MHHSVHITAPNSSLYQFFVQDLIKLYGDGHEFIYDSNKKISTFLDLDSRLKSKSVDYIFLNNISSYKYLIPKLKKVSEVPISLFLLDETFSKIDKTIARPFIQRIDHFFVANRLMIDKLWSVFGISPSRCTNLGFDNFLYTDEGLPTFSKITKKNISKIGFLGSDKMYSDLETFTEGLLHNPEINEVDCWISQTPFSESKVLMNSFEKGIPILCPPCSSIIEARETMPELVKFIDPNSSRSITKGLEELRSSCHSYMISTELPNFRYLAIKNGMTRATKRRAAWKSKFLKI